MVDRADAGWQQLGTVLDRVIQDLERVFKEDAKLTKAEQKKLATECYEAGEITASDLEWNIAVQGLRDE